MTASMRGSMDLDGNVDKLQQFYATWADDYDADVASHAYDMPAMVRDTLNHAVADLGWGQPRSEVEVLDAGCGTGLVGDALHRNGWTNLRGVDLSAEMTTKAQRRGIYQTLTAGVDLTQPLPAALQRSAHVVTVGGVFTVGHVPPEALSIMATMVKPGGLLVASVRQAYLKTTNWHAVIDRLTKAGTLTQIVHRADQPYTMDSVADYWAWAVP